MSTLRRVLLLLSVAVLLREGSSNSPLDFLRDLKNRIFATGNSTEYVEQAQCSGDNQDEVCALQNSARNGSQDENDFKMFENSNLINDTLISDTETLAANQSFDNETVNVETYNTNNTVYYDEQVLNDTSKNNTDYLENDLEYQEIEQNATLNTETLPSNSEETNQTDNTRSKRQIKKVEINITLKTPKVTSKPLTLSTTVFMGKPENSTDSNKNNTSELVHANLSENNLPGIKNESTPVELVKSINENETVTVTGLSGNETEENILQDEQRIIELTNTTSDSLEDLETANLNDTDFSELQNTTDETLKNESNSTNCTSCMDIGKEHSNLLSDSLNSSKDVNATEFTESDQDGNINVNATKTMNDYVNVTDQTNMTNIANMLENTTQELVKIAQNVVPASMINYLTNNTDTITSLLSPTSESKVIQSQNLILNDSTAFENNLTYNLRTERAKRSINLTILSDDDELDFSKSTFPDTTEIPVAETFNTTEPSQPNEVESFETEGPVCLKRYEQCTSSSDCCKNYECISTEGPNSTFYCDLTPPTTLPLKNDKTQ